MEDSEKGKKRGTIHGLKDKSKMKKNRLKLLKDQYKVVCFKGRGRNETNVEKFLPKPWSLCVGLEAAVWNELHDTALTLYAVARSC